MKILLLLFFHFNIIHNGHQQSSHHRSGYYHGLRGDSSIRHPSSSSSTPASKPSVLNIGSAEPSLEADYSFSPEYYNPSNDSQLRLSEIDDNGTTCHDFRATFDSKDVFPKLGFHASWTKNRWFWNADDFNFEQRYRDEFGGPGERNPIIKVFIVPHSHCDPGWLKTFEGYYHSHVRHTLDLTVEKLTMFPNMTFVWNEISFLSLWWERARVEQKMQFLQLIKEGRLEILTGGWVMPDEATTTIYALTQQLIEGRQWVWNNLGILPNVSWAIDPFGHSSTMPYLVKQAGMGQMVVQRLHYAWKKYLAEKRYENFKWVQRWDTEGRDAILCHNEPYDIYTTKHTCGPDPKVCLKLDFRNMPGEYSEYVRHARPVNEIHLPTLATEMVQQFQRTASLSPSNVVLFLLGEDFRFDKSQEWDQQYENYVPLVNYVNRNFDTYGVDLQFGTVSDYFAALNTEQHNFPTFSGDFFPYSDVYLSARPAYWTGYYGTRPYYKKFYRETESNLRSAEILYAYAVNFAKDPVHVITLNKEYESLVKARRYLALFSHHDGTTGTSRKSTMEDYGHKLMETSRSSLQIQRQSIRAILKEALNISVSSLGKDSQILNFGDLSTKIPRVIYESDMIVKKVLIFNSLSFKKVHLVRAQITSPMVKVFGPHGHPVLSQVNPIVDVVDNQLTFTHLYELVFLAELEGLSLQSYEIRRAGLNDSSLATLASVYCNNCKAGRHGNESFRNFEVQKNTQAETIIIGNGEMDLYLNASSGYLQHVAHIGMEVSMPMYLQFGGYRSIFRDSGAYLLKVEEEEAIKIPFGNGDASVLVVEGPVTSYVTSHNAPITLTTRLVGSVGQGIQMENLVDLGNVAGEIFMRIDTGLNTTTESVHGQLQPTFYTDQNGYTYEKRVKVPWIKYEGNVYPVTQAAYMEDRGKDVRLSWIVDRSHGFNSMESGRLETLIERRTLFDDGRGIGEGVTDNRRTISNYVLHFEKITPSILDLQHLSIAHSYQPSIYGFDDTVGSWLGTLPLLTQPLPLTSHLLGMRTLEQGQPKILMTLLSLGSSCEGESLLFHNNTRFSHLASATCSEATLDGILVEYTSGGQSFPTLRAKPFEVKSIVVTISTSDVIRRHFHSQHRALNGSSYEKA